MPTYKILDQEMRVLTPTPISSCEIQDQGGIVISDSGENQAFLKIGTRGYLYNFQYD